MWKEREGEWDELFDAGNNGLEMRDDRSLRWTRLRPAGLSLRFRPGRNRWTKYRVRTQAGSNAIR
jgi:hypothetical protein